MADHRRSGHSGEQGSSKRRASPQLDDPPNPTPDLAPLLAFAPSGIVELANKIMEHNVPFFGMEMRVILDPHIHGDGQPRYKIVNMHRAYAGWRYLIKDIDKGSAPAKWYYEDHLDVLNSETCVANLLEDRLVKSGLLNKDPQAREWGLDWRRGAVCPFAGDYQYYASKRECIDLPYLYSH